MELNYKITKVLNDDREAHIGFILGKKANKLLNDAVRRSKRTKKKEALLRLEDHLFKYISISEVGEVKEREIDQ